MGLCGEWIEKEPFLVEVRYQHVMSPIRIDIGLFQSVAVKYDSYEYGLYEFHFLHNMQ
jgi:hypothetical protein